MELGISFVQKPANSLREDSNQQGSYSTFTNGLATQDTENESGITSEVFKEGILDIHVHYAEQIPNICIYGKQDVFGKFFVLDMEDDAVCTKVSNNAGHNPVFDEKLRVKFSQPNAVLKCEMWMASRDTSYLPDQVLGSVKIPLSEILAKQKYAEDYGLSSTELCHSPAGTVRLSFSFTESSASSDVIRVVNLDTRNESGITSEAFKEGILDIHVHYAEQIHNICIYGKQDVFGKFFVLKMEDDAVCTKVLNNAGQNPVFDEKLRVKISQPNAVLKCEMWMASRDKSYLPDQVLGFVEIPFSEILAKQKYAEGYGLSSTGLWHSRAGTVRLSFSFTESSATSEVTRVVNLDTGNESESGITSEVFKEGILDIHVHYAEQIHNICIYGKQDVFGKLFVLEMEKDAICTKVSNNAGQNPVFDEKLRLKIFQPNAVLKCEMWMASRDKSYLPDQMLGFVEIPLSEILAKQKHAEDYGLSSSELCHSPAGTVRLSFSFTESSESFDVTRVVDLGTNIATLSLNRC